jgi:Pentapeptide repeats (8 copies)
MALYPILHRWSTTPIALVEASSFARALEVAVGRQVTLRYADLRGTVAPGVLLDGADLGGVDLSNSILPGARLRAARLRSGRLAGAFLQEADLGEADLRDADLRVADLRVANLEGARLVGADLRGALVYGSKFAGAVVDWRWSGIPLEILRQELSGDDARGLVINPPTDDAERPFAWLKAILSQGARARGALRVLSRYIRPEDNAPELLRRLAADTFPGAVALADDTAFGSDIGPLSPAPAAPPMLWTRRRAARTRPIVCRFG